MLVSESRCLRPVRGYPIKSHDFLVFRVAASARHVEGRYLDHSGEFLLRHDERYHQACRERGGPAGSGFFPQRLQPPVYVAMVFENRGFGAENSEARPPFYPDRLEPDFHVPLVYRADFAAAG